MAEAYKRHDISDEAWERLEPQLPGRKGTWGGNARDNRQFINAVFWILRTEAQWRDLPQLTETGRILIGDFVVGETEEYGRNCWKNYWMSQNLNF